MPRRDGTGPMGIRSMSGRGLGFCAGADEVKHKADSGKGLRFSCRCNCSSESSETQKELLQKRKNILQKRLEVIDKQLENL